MSSTPAFLFYFNDWLASTSSMKTIERGYYIQLLSQQASLGALPNDLEELAFLAGARFNELDAFKQAYKRTLKAKFEVNEQGMLVNSKLINVMARRNNYSEKQVKRGKIGALVKKAIKEFNLNKIEQSALRSLINEKKIYEENIEKLEGVFKHTLKAFIINRDRNRIIDSIEINKGGVGENLKRRKDIQQTGLDFDLPKRYSTSSTKHELIIPFSEVFNQIWQQWKSYLKAEHNSGYNSIQSEQASLKTVASLARGIEEKAIAIVEQSMANRWKTFYELKNKTNSKNENSNSNIYPDEFLAKHGLL